MGVEDVHDVRATASNALDELIDLRKIDRRARE
jgi:hypothetical protein